MTSPSPAQTDDLVGLKRGLRRVFGAFATGITVVTTRDSLGRPVGFTANSFTSVSLDPPLLLVCLGKSSSNIENFREAAGFAVNILAEDQEEVSKRFASPLTDRFAGLSWHPGKRRSPILDGIAAWFDCTRHDVVDAGDHVILIGRIQEFGSSGRPPLLYLGGQYHRLSAPAGDQNRSTSSIRVGVLATSGQRILLRRAQGGWDLPIGPPRALFEEACAACEMEFASIGVLVNMMQPYSIFDDVGGRESRFLFLAELDPSSHLSGDTSLFGMDELPTNISDPGTAAVLSRHARECRDGRFSVYVGSRTKLRAAGTAFDGAIRRQDISRPEESVQ